MLIAFMGIILGSPTLTIAAIIGFTIIRLSSDKMFHKGKWLLNLLSISYWKLIFELSCAEISNE